jgi:hypothetical protein
MPDISQNWGEKICYAGRTEDFAWSLYDRDGEPLAIAVDDHVRFKLAATPGATPALDIDSVGATSAGSVVTIEVRGTAGVTPASGTVRLAQDDTSGLTARKYTGCELALVDNSETAPADAIKVCGRGTIDLKASPGGDVGLT